MITIYFPSSWQGLVPIELVEWMNAHPAYAAYGSMGFIYSTNQLCWTCRMV